MARSSSATVFETLVAKPSPPARKIALIRDGAPARLVGGMADYLGLTKNQVFEILRTPTSTAHRLLAANDVLDPAATERVVRVADITRLAESVMGSRALASAWLRTPNRALGNGPPLALLDTEPGAAEVRRVLSSIEGGGVY